MSEGLLCLTCRRYLHATDAAWRCRCAAPRPSFDGRTVTPAALAAARQPPPDDARPTN